MCSFIIGVAGGTGSGKTTLVQAIVEQIGTENVTVIEHDSYYRDRSHISPKEREHINYDHPNALETRLLVSHLRQLREGSQIDVPVYDFSTHTRHSYSQTVHPSKVIVVEGILIFTDPELRELMNVRIFVETDDDIRLLRRLRRDISERGRTLESVLEQYLDTVRPMHIQYVEPSRKYADVVIPEGGMNRVAIDILVTKIAAILEGDL